MYSVIVIVNYDKRSLAISWCNNRKHRELHISEDFLFVTRSDNIRLGLTLFYHPPSLFLSLRKQRF